jgi:hypothetical protein
LLFKFAPIDLPTVPYVAHRQGGAVLIEDRLNGILCRRICFSPGGQSFVRLRLGDIVVNQVGRRLYMVVRCQLLRLLLLPLQECINDRLIVTSECIGDAFLGMQINA